MADILVTATLILIMFGIGMSLTFGDFKNIFKVPRDLFTGLAAQALLLPVTAFALAYFAPLKPEFKIGIVLIALCPVGTTSNILVHIFKANTALSISMTIINSLICPLTIPILTSLAAVMFIDSEAHTTVSFIDSVVHVLLNVILPASAGLMVRKYFIFIADKLKKPLDILMPILLLAVFTIKIFFNDNDASQPLSIHETLIILTFVAALNIIGMYGGYWIANITKLKKASRLTVAIETGLQNTTLALSIASCMPYSSEVEKPILVYAAITFFTAVIFLIIHSDVKFRLSDILSTKE